MARKSFELGISFELKNLAPKINNLFPLREQTGRRPFVIWQSDI
jgi:hypothetical protein